MLSSKKYLYGLETVVILPQIRQKLPQSKKYLYGLETTEDKDCKCNYNRSKKYLYGLETTNVHFTQCQSIKV